MSIYILLINSFTSIALTYIYFKNKQKEKEIDKKFETLFTKFCQIEHKINNMDLKIQDLNEIVDELEYTAHLVENKNKSQSKNNIQYQNLNNIEEYIMLVK
jgi:hypothetical protein